MSKKRSPARLLRSLSEFGFELGDVSPIENSFSFTRQRHDGLYEWISCDFAGKEGEAAVCRIEASVTRIVPLKGLTENELLLDVALDPERGWTVVECDADLRQWEASVVKAAVPRVKEFADKISQLLLARTEHTRRDVRDCLCKLSDLGSPNDAYRRLRNGASDEQLAVASRLAGWPGVLQIAGCEFEYDLACLAIVRLLRADHLPDPDDVDQMPLENEQLMWEIQLLADELIGAGRTQTHGLNRRGKPP